MAYFIIDDGSIYRTLIANLKKDNINPIQFRHQPWGNSQIKRIATYFVIQRNVRCFSLIVLADSQLYVIPEDQFQSSITIQPLSLTDCDYIDDFCVTPSGDRLCVLSKKKITYYSTSNNFSQISKMVECVDSNITCNNDNVLVYGKGVQMFSIGFSTRGIDYQSTAIRKAGCAYGIIQNEFDSINNCELSATYQFYLLRSKGNYDDVKNQISFIGDGPYTNFKWPIQDEIVDFTISYPYAFATHGKTFEMICIPNQKLVQSTTFNSSFNNQTICPLPNRTLLIGLGSTLLFLRFIEANLQVRASMNAAKVPGADVANALHTAISVCLSFPEYEPEISTLKKELFHSYGEELLNKKNTVKQSSISREISYLHISH